MGVVVQRYRFPLLNQWISNICVLLSKFLTITITVTITMPQPWMIKHSRCSLINIPETCVSMKLYDSRTTCGRLSSSVSLFPTVITDSRLYENVEHCFSAIFLLYFYYSASISLYLYSISFHCFTHGLDSSYKHWKRGQRF